MKLQVQAAPENPYEILSADLSGILILPDEECAVALNRRLIARKWVQDEYGKDYAERMVIIREFEIRSLWLHLLDPDTGENFSHITHWLKSGFLGCARTNMEIHSDLKKLSAEVASEKLLGAPKDNIKTLLQLSTGVQTQPDVIEAVTQMEPEKFEEKIEREHPHQHIEKRTPMKFSPGRSWAKIIEEALAWALEHDIAGTRDEALFRMAETALDEWQFDYKRHSEPEEVEA